MNLSKLDHPKALMFIFHPQKDMSVNPVPGAIDYEIAVDDKVAIGCRFYCADQAAPSILYFHGNAEIVSLYDDAGPVYNQHGLNLIAVDYRGYGRSGGTPTVTAMLSDAHIILREVKKWLKHQGMSGPLLVMGRSLGSTCALELASQHEKELSGLIIESGFAYTVPLLDYIGVNTKALGIREEDCFRQIEKIERFSKPTLIIHAEHDQFIPVSDAEVLFQHSPAQKKELRIIPGADHNNILMMAGMSYFKVIREFIT